jgi:phosphoserine phosphatase RsbX
MAVSLGLALRPLTGETVCGDRGAWWLAEQRIVLAVADGLGHGEAAAQAAEAALACIGDNLDCDCAELFARCNVRLQATRGAALAIAIVEPLSGRTTLGTVGNIRAMLLRDAADLRLGGARGIVGGGYKAFTPETLELAPGNVLALFSDGLDEFPALRECFADPAASAQTQAQAILERWARPTDDAAVLIYRHPPCAGEV